MFCSNCGAEASGKFCSKCGTPQEAPPTAAAPAHDWSREVRYEKLIRVPEVRDTISRHAGMARKAASPEEFLALAEKIVPLGFSVATLGAVVQPIFAQIGLRTGKEYADSLPSPPGTVIVSALCSLARRGQTLRQVRQFEEGCLLEASLPADIWSSEGTLYVAVRRDGSGTRVEGATKIEGQLFDWGKSRRCLDALFADVKAVPA